jgi:hypothetical protein
MPWKCLFLGRDLRQIGEIWTHLLELDLRRRQQNVSKHFHVRTAKNGHTIPLKTDLFEPLKKSIQTMLLKGLQ